MLLRDVLHELDAIAPLRYAEPWDNVGLLAGDRDRPVGSALLAIDYTPEVAREARALGCELVVAYHPPIFAALKRVAAPSPIFEAIRDGIALYSPHTALDVAPGGTNDMLADALGMAEERTPLKVAPGKGSHYKLVTFVPERDLEAVGAALFAAGAGRIGQYSSCSFRSPGTGTFFGEEGTNPAVGERGRLEVAPEVRLETVLPIDKTAAAIKALRAAHPYEEPAFDLVELAAEPTGLGIGRVGALAEPAPLDDVLERIKRELGLSRLLVAEADLRAGAQPGVVARAAACAGACGDLVQDAIQQRVDLYLTGELRHHDALAAARAGVTVVCTLHSNSERAVLRRVQRRLEEKLPSLRVMISAQDRDPFAFR